MFVLLQKDTMAPSANKLSELFEKISKTTKVGLLMY